MNANKSLVSRCALVYYNEKCEGCESKKCKIAVGRTHVRARREFSTVRRVNSSSPTLPYHELGKMDGNRQTRSEQEIAKRDRVREGRCVLQHVTTQFCKIDFSNKKISKKKCHFSVDFSLFRLISSHILIGGRGKEEWRKRQATGDKDRKWGERRKEEARRKKRAKEERMQKREWRESEGREGRRGKKAAKKDGCTRNSASASKLAFWCGRAQWNEVVPYLGRW